MVLLFLGRLFSEGRKRLNSCQWNELPFCSLRSAFQSKTRLSSLFKFKYSIPKYLHSHLVYKFLYSCCNATYYGETERHLFARAPEHPEITPLTQKLVKSPNETYLLEGPNAVIAQFSYPKTMHQKITI